MNGFEAYLARTRALVGDFLEVFFALKRRDLARVRPWGSDVLRRLEAFTAAGKMMRGGLACLGAELTGRPLAADAVRAGAALELVQSGLLVHDDIMDRDETRRGRPSVHRQYARLGREQGMASPDRLGASLGICAGEIALFLAFEALAGLTGPDPARREAQEMFAAEFGRVGLGQMLDIVTGASPRPAAEREVLNLYRLKTARYSFSLPLALGWTLAGGAAATRERLERLGERIGVAFQLRDDELGLFGDEAVTGKPVGSDLRQGKRTPLYLRTRALAGPRDRRALAAAFGRADASNEAVRRAREIAERTGARAAVRSTMNRLAAGARRELRALPVAEGRKRTLESLLDFAVLRDR